MATAKSHTEFALGFYKVLLTRDMVRQYEDLSVSFLRDYKKLSSRVKNEGFSFLTKTLPTLAKAIDKALVCGSFTCPSAFKRLRGTAYPCFLQGLLKLVFNQDGSVKTEPSITAVRDLRQVLYLFYKYEQPYSEEVIYDFLDNFKRVDVSLGWDYPSEVDIERDNIVDCARALLTALLGDLDIQSIIPGHGPGAVATGEQNWEKMTFRTKYLCIHEILPYYKFCHANAMDLAASVSEYWARDVVPSGIAKICLVPKDSRGPRLISEEPLEFQYFQQGLKDLIYKAVEAHRWTKGHVNFTDQEINRNLARRGSISGDNVTLDMKEASDRISIWLVRELFRDTSLLNGLLATRTEATELPSGEIFLLRKFAPMGSATCFPVEALVHWSLSVATLHVVNGVSLQRARRAVYVYGDDIVIKGENHVPLFTTFPKLGLKFNEDKCCTTGIFRESCGMDAVLGQGVTPLKLKKNVPSSPYDADKYVAYLEVINELWNAAYYSSSHYVQEYIEEIFGVLPHVEQDSDAPGIVNRRGGLDSNAHLFSRRWNRDLQRAEFLVKKTRGRKHYVPMDRCEYHRKLMIKSVDFRAGIYSVPHRIKLTTGWTAHLI